MIARRLIRRLLGRPRNAADDFPVVDMDAVWGAPPVSAEGKKLVFAFSIGRSGMRWFAKLFQNHANCRAHSERFPLYETFYRYATWNKLPVDMSGFCHLLQQSIYNDWALADISYNASPFYNAGIPDLASWFDMDLMIFHLRNPVDVVNSFESMGWYADPLHYEDVDKAPGIQSKTSSFHHNFARVLPRGEEFEQFRRMTRIGRIAWFCNTGVKMIHEALNDLPSEKQWHLRLDAINQNYDFYRAAAENVGLTPVLSEKAYLNMRSSMGNILKKKRTYADWTPREKQEYESMIGDYVEIYDSAELPKL